MKLELGATNGKPIKSVWNKSKTFVLTRNNIQQSWQHANIHRGTLTSKRDFRSSKILRPNDDSFKYSAVSVFFTLKRQFKWKFPLLTDTVRRKSDYSAADRHRPTCFGAQHFHCGATVMAGPMLRFYPLPPTQSPIIQTATAQKRPTGGIFLFKTSRWSHTCVCRRRGKV